MYLFEKLYQTLALVFDYVSKHLEYLLKNSAVPCFSTSVFNTRTRMSDTLLHVNFSRKAVGFFLFAAQV